MPPTAPSQMKMEVNIQEFSLPKKIEKESPSMPKKGRKIKTPIKKRKRVIKKVFPIPSIPKHIPKEEEEENDEDDVPLNRRTWLARTIE